MPGIALIALNAIAALFCKIIKNRQGQIEVIERPSHSLFERKGQPNPLRVTESVAFSPGKKQKFYPLSRIKLACG